MDRLYNMEAWQVLAKCQDIGSVSRTAEVLGLEISTVSRMISGLEKALGRELVDRTRRPYALNAAGEEAAAKVRAVLEAHTRFLSEITEDAGRMEGVLRLGAAGGLLQTVLMPMLLEFQKFYPDIRFDVKSGRQVEACLRGQVDVAGVTGETDAPGLVCMNRGRSVFIPVASPAYVRDHGMPADPADLSHHFGFLYSGPVRPRTEQLSRDGQSSAIPWGHTTLTSDVLMIKNAVMNGIGIAVDLPLMHCQKELAEGSLVVILNGWHRPPLNNYAVCSEAAWRLRRVRIFMQWWCTRFRRYFRELEQGAERTLGPGFEQYLR